MAKNTERIERDIEAARNQLAGTLDQLAVHANPQRIVGDVTDAVVDKLKTPKIVVPVVGGATLIGGTIAFLILRRIIRIFR